MNLFPDFDDNLRNAFQRETELFFGSIVHEDRSVLDLLTADYTFVNERLAKHYGIPNIYGPQFRRVTLPPELDMRRGLLGKGALLTVTSDGGPHFAGGARQVVPANVPGRQSAGSAAERAGDQGKTGGLDRKREGADDAPDDGSASHQSGRARRATRSSSRSDWRSKTSTRSAPGARRTRAVPIDATGVLVDGTKVDGVASLRDSLVRRSDQFVRVVTEKLLTYALGRGVEYQDMPLVRSIVRDSAASKYRFSSLVLGIVKSPAFQMNMKTAEAAANSGRHVNR